MAILMHAKDQFETLLMEHIHRKTNLVPGLPTYKIRHTREHRAEVEKRTKTKLFNRFRHQITPKQKSDEEKKKDQYAETENTPLCD